MAELIKATNITKVRIEDEAGEGTQVHAMLRIYVHPGLYILTRFKHGPSPSGRTSIIISQFLCSPWVLALMDNSDEILGEADSLAEAVQVALLELHK